MVSDFWYPPSIDVLNTQFAGDGGLGAEGAARGTSNHLRGEAGGL